MRVWLFCCHFSRIMERPFIKKEEIYDEQTVLHADDTSTHGVAHRWHSLCWQATARASSLPALSYHRKDLRPPFALGRSVSVSSGARRRISLDLIDIRMRRAIAAVAPNVL